MDTLVATYNTNIAGNKTITGCTSGQPLLFVHKVKGNQGGCAGIKIASGAIHETSSASCAYLIGAGIEFWTTTNIFVAIPNASSVVVYLEMDSDDTVYVFRS